MRTLSDIINSTTDRDERDALLYELLGIDSPGAYALREPDGRVFVWASVEAAEGDDGARATYRSPRPIQESEWAYICKLAWIDEYESSWP